ncbi:hypothetical protein [Terriglobus albidus]|uniref:hypothetical protein n=1 Tax=Terriglobus albidus TaxID=1592106 RepID=UPI0021DFF614|nr:hypothetical protein [Terriglobus albidus]
MTRLLKSVAMFFLIVTFLTPLLECFDGWDRPGLTNDIEFSGFLIVVLIMLALLAVVATARRFLDAQCYLTVAELRCVMPGRFSSSTKSIVIAPLLILPLRT